MTRNPDLAGIAAMTTATALFVIGDSFMKLVTEDLPPFQVLFLRGIPASLALALVVALRGEWRALSGAGHPRALLRALGETLSTLCYVSALALMPIALLIGILQVAPLALLLGAALILGDRVGPLRLGLALLGFVGALMVIQPGADGLSPAALFAVAAALLIAARDLFGRTVPTTIPVTVAILATAIMVMLAAGALSLATETWVPPTARHLGFLTLAALFVATGQVLLFLAYRLGQTATVAPFFYSFALWGVLAGLIVWGDLPDALALAGIAVITGSGLAIVLIDRRDKGQGAAKAAE